jgi:hypothetical protein
MSTADFLRSIYEAKDGFLRSIYEASSKFFLEDEQNISTPEFALEEEIKKSYQEWQKAQQYFECVTEPELIDHAIFLEEAAKRKYIYLLNKAKNQGISS